MPRRTLKPREKRPPPKPDYKYGSVLVAKLLNKINFRGKKSIAEKILYGALEKVKEKTKEEPIEVLKRAVENVRPLVEVKPRRVGGATYQVPVEVGKERSITLALRWMVEFAQEKEGRPMVERLSEEIIAASRQEGAAFKKREETHKMAEANKAFAHYRW